MTDKDDQWASFVGTPFHCIDYKKGDYARAALKIIKGANNENERTND